MVLCLKTWESRSSPGLQRTETSSLSMPSSYLRRRIAFDAGWSSPVARQAHNLKAAGSNPAPATIFICSTKSSGLKAGSFSFACLESRRIAASSPRTSTRSLPCSGISTIDSTKPRISSRAGPASSASSAACNSATLRREASAMFGCSRGAGAPLVVSSLSRSRRRRSSYLNFSVRRCAGSPSARAPTRRSI
jgi:hypothetical protein